jgi:hypothetical protein
MSLSFGNEKEGIIIVPRLDFFKMKASGSRDTN